LTTRSVISEDYSALDWLDEITADSPRRIKGGISDRCGAQCPDLPKVL
jgi:hypothetical protein